MNISFNWLKQYIPLTISPEETAKKLTSLGLEVGTVEAVQRIKGGLEGLVVAEVMQCEPHPDSDHLHITQVDNGSGELLQVVCGAPNCRTGIKTIMATIGTRLYEGDKCFTIKKSKLRGVDSLGMLCAEDEIGIGHSHEGIIELPNDTPVGMPAKAYYQIEDDYLIEVDITPNRSDAISHFGVARDLAAGLNLPLLRPSVESFRVENNTYPIQVEVLNTKACPRYSGITITGLTVKESPDWLKERLTVIGMRPINNVVDVSNFILHELGQPLHTFDADKIKGRTIRVTTLPDQTPFVTLDGVERKLSDNDLMICNVEEPMCIAGVFGGLDSGVTEKTTRVFIESAYFNPVSIRKTARRHGLNTDASFRYERGCDPNINLYALKRAALLIQEVAGGSISSNIVDIYPKPIEDARVELRYDKVNSLIGKNMPKDEVKSILNRLEIKIDKETEEGLLLRVPPYRADVTRDVDVIEDILRIYGYNNILPGTVLKSGISYVRQPDANALQNRIAGHLTGAGFNEIMNNSLTKVSYYENLQSYPLAAAVRIINPLGSDLSILRQTLLFGGLESIARNRNRQRNNLRFYEFGHCYHYHPEKADNEQALAAYSEENHIGIWMCGNCCESIWTDSARPLTFFDLKSHVINCLERLGIEAGMYQAQVYDSDLYRQAIQLVTRSGEPLVTLGIVADKLLRNFDIHTEVYFADMDWEPLIRQTSKTKTEFSELPRFPEVRRDLALLLDKQVSFAQVESLAHDIERKLLTKVVLFDVYEGKNLEPGKKSYAVSFTLQDSERTLEDRQIDQIMQKLMQAFTTKLGAIIR